MLVYEDAFLKMLAEAETFGSEPVPLQGALGRVLASDIRAGLDLPPFHNSAMDGYAVRHGDVSEASAASPAKLGLAGESAAGRPFGGCVEAGTAVIISTGASLPEGADAVVRLEDTRPAGDGAIEILEPARAGLHVRRRGEDTEKGTLLAECGTTLDVGLLSLLAGVGLAEVETFVRPKVSICATGTELAKPGSPLGDGQIYESNALLLRNLSSLTPVEVVGSGTVEDDPDRTREHLAAAMERSDVLCISGGVSVGKHDLVKAALQELGVEEVFWKVRVKPGKPLFFGKHRRRSNSSGGTRGGWVFALPGNPVSCLTSFVMFVEPFLRAAGGCVDTRPLTAGAVLTESVRSRSSRRLFVTARLGMEGSTLVACPVSGQGSGMLHSMVGVNGYVVIPEDTEFVDKGEEVQAVLLPGFRMAGLRGDVPDVR